MANRIWSLEGMVTKENARVAQQYIKVYVQPDSENNKND